MRLEQKSKAEISRLKAAFQEVGLEFEDDLSPAKVWEARTIAEPTLDRKDAPQSEACGKAVYTTESEARRMAKTRKKYGAGFLRVYFCSDCHGFHLTKRPNNK